MGNAILFLMQPPAPLNTGPRDSEHKTGDLPPPPPLFFDQAFLCKILVLYIFLNGFPSFLQNVDSGPAKKIFFLVLDLHTYYMHIHHTHTTPHGTHSIPASQQKPSHPRHSIYCISTNDTISTHSMYTRHSQIALNTEDCLQTNSINSCTMLVASGGTAHTIGSP